MLIDVVHLASENGVDLYLQHLSLLAANIGDKLGRLGLILSCCLIACLSKAEIAVKGIALRIPLLP